LERQANIIILTERMATPKYTMTQQAIEEEWLLVQAVQKNPARFSSLYTRYYERIFRFAYQRTADEEISADLSSQTFLKAYENIGKYKHRGVPFSAWLYTIALNEVNQYFRKTNKNRVVTLEENYVNNIKYELDNKEELEINIAMLGKVIQMLKPDELILIELRYFEERPFKEVGDILGITETNAKVKVHRLIQKMKELFNDLTRD
jgi:RNA polymerase sigma-70 factor, ECF subfamily